MTTEKYSVETIRDYLLGLLPEADAERLDELSITNEEFAERMRSVEHDLADAFARWELQGTALEQFRSRYLTTPRGREATRFAEALQSLDAQIVETTSSEAHHGQTKLVRQKRRWRDMLALAAVLMLAATSVWLVLNNRTLRARVTSAESARDERERQLREAEAARTANTPPSPNTGSALTVATLVLAPQLRSARQLPTVSLTDGIQELPVRLDLEPVDYPSYTASLLASNGERQLWVAERLIGRTAGGRQTIDLRVPATLLSPQDYLIRVSGVPARGASEIVGEYRFTVVR